MPNYWHFLAPSCYLDRYDFLSRTWVELGVFWTTQEAYYFRARYILAIAVTLLRWPTGVKFRLVNGATNEVLYNDFE